MTLPPEDASSRESASPRTDAAYLAWFSFHPLDSEGSEVCRRILAVYLAGYYLLYTQWLQFGWLAAALVVAGRKIDWKGMWKLARADALVQTALVFLGWMTLRSLLVGAENPKAWLQDAGPWLMGALGLIVFAALTWQAAIHLRALAAVGVVVGGAAALAAITSIVLFYFVLPYHGLGERLSDWFVFGGLNPVCTGLIFGFAALWIICVKGRWRGSLWFATLTAAQVMVLVAMLFTRSRGALLAVGAGHAALIMTRGWRPLWGDALVLVLVITSFQLSGPLISDLAWRQTQARLAPTLQTQNHAVPAPPQTQGNELVREMLDRADSGRLEIYRAGLANLWDAKAWLFGLGQWNSDQLWRDRLDPKWPPEHLHSAYLATLVHGGLIGLGLLLALIFQGLRRAWTIARGNDFTWWVLLVYGVTALLFDGQTFTRLNSVPLFEPLLVAFPLTAAASGWVHQKRGAQRVTSSMNVA